jgi:hypothetical protein
MSFLANTAVAQWDDVSPTTIANLTGSEFQVPGGGTQVHVVLVNTGIPDVEVFAVDSNGDPFPGNQGYFNLKPGIRLELEFKFPLILKMYHGGTVNEYYPIGVHTNAQVSVLAYRN